MITTKQVNLSYSMHWLIFIVLKLGSTFINCAVFRAGYGCDFVLCDERTSHRNPSAYHT
jgi:hypothetical protein